MMSSHPDWKNLISECFKSTEFMALSTYGVQGLWVNPVYFSWNGKSTLYFISQMDCRHMNNIVSSPEVACAIFPTNNPAGNDVFGAYIKGNAEIVEDKEEMELADSVYYSRIYSEEEADKKETDTYRADPSWKFVKISIVDMSYFDTRYFEETRVEVPETIWK